MYSTPCLSNELLCLYTTVRPNLCRVMKQRLAKVSGVSPGCTPLAADLPGMPIWDTSAYQGRESTSDYLRTSTRNSEYMGNTLHMNNKGRGVASGLCPWGCVVDSVDMNETSSRCLLEEVAQSFLFHPHSLSVRIYLVMVLIVEYF